MPTLNVSEAKAKFFVLVEEVRQGGEVILCKPNVPVVKLVLVKSESVKQSRLTAKGVPNSHHLLSIATPSNQRFSIRLHT